MEKKRRNMLLYVTATSMVGIACNDQHAVGDVAQSPDFRVGKIAMVVPDAAVSPPAPAEDAAAAAQAPATEAITDAGDGKSRDAAAWMRPPTTPRQLVRPPGKIAAPPDK